MITVQLHASSLLAMLLLLTACKGQAGSPCPSSDWQLLGNVTCVQFVDNFRLKAGQARKWCASVGSALLRFSDSDSVVDFAAAARQRRADGWWTGLNDVGQPGVWTWGGDERVSPGALNWATEPTDTHHVENCVSMDYSGLLSDDDCSQRMGFICSYAPDTPGSCLGEFKAAGGRCYLLPPLDDPRERVPWSAAGATCRAMGDMLVGVGSPPSLATFTTADQLKGLQQLVANTMTPGKRWVGLNDRAEERQWAWPDNSTVLDVSVFEDQWKTYPDRGTGHSCGLAHSSGQIEEASCKDQHHFACQFNVNPGYFRLVNGLGCPAPWLRGGKKCYFFTKRQASNHDDTRTFCSRMKGTLLKIESVDERDWVVQQTYLKKIFNMWTGLRRSSDGGSAPWVWDDGSAADSTLYLWNQEPSNLRFRKEHCAFINTMGTYNSASCFTALSFICEMSTEVVPCPKNWLSDDSGDMTSCYYVSTNETDGMASWQEALNKCRQLAGIPDAHLVAVNSVSELDYMRSLMTTHPFAGYWTDLTDKNLTGLWVFSETYEGTPPAPIPWDKEPNNRDGHENCAVMYMGGMYNDVDCATTAHIACERPAAGVSSGASAIFHRKSTGVRSTLTTSSPLVPALGVVAVFVVAFVL